MARKTLLNELLDDNLRRIKKLLSEDELDFLFWSPDGAGNNIAVTIWHAARIHDVYLTQHIYGKPAEAEIWLASGWAVKSGYDPRGVGTNGWGTVSGYTQDEVGQIPAFEADLLLGYFEEIAAAIRTYLENTSEVDLDLPSVGFDGKQMNYYWIRHPLFDMTRHVGEMLAIKAMWDRQQTNFEAP